jgi:hypothetical protein
MSCGCGKPNDDHGDARHITLTDLDQAAQAATISRDEAARNIMQTYSQMGSTQGQPVQASASPDA